MSKDEARKPPKTVDSLSFEASMNELEDLVAALENGDLSLEESLSTFEKGVRLTKACQQHLAQAEQKINVLTASGESVEFIADQSQA